jgi:integrase
VSIYKRDGDHYWYKFMYRGKFYCASTRQSNAKAAKEIESAKRTALAKAEEGIFARKPAPTFRDFCAKEFEPRISKTVGGSITKKTWDDFYMVGIKALKSYEPLAECRLDEIDEELIGRFKAYRLTGSADGKRKAVSTVNSSIRVLRRILNKAVEWHMPRKGVFFLDKTPGFDFMKGENKRDYVVPFADEAAYLKEAQGVNPLLSDVVTILLDSAIRPEECHRLRWECVSWEGGLHGVFQVARGKTDNARRELPMSARVRGVFERRWKSAGRPAVGWVFPAPTESEHIEPSSLKKAHAKALKQSQVRSFVLYDLRHTSLTRLACECREPWTLARIAGHGGIKIGQQYVHSHRMERSPWWAEWWTYISAGQVRKGKPRKQAKKVGTNLGTEANVISMAVLQ